MKFHNDMESSVDVIYVNGVLFLTTESEHVHFGTITALDNLNYQSLEFELKTTIRSCTVRGFCISLVVVGMQFKVLRIRTC